MLGVGKELLKFLTLAWWVGKMNYIRKKTNCAGVVSWIIHNIVDEKRITSIPTRTSYHTIKDISTIIRRIISL